MRSARVVTVVCTVLVCGCTTAPSIGTTMNGDAARIRILSVDDHRPVRQGSPA